MIKLNKKEIFKLNKGLKIEHILNDIADKFSETFYNGITKTSTDINGVDFKPLAKSTIQEKKDAGYKYPDKPLYAKGKLRNAYVSKKATKVNKIATVSMNIRDREEPSVIHNMGLLGMPKREWFGIGSVQKKAANAIARAYIKKALKATGPLV